MFKNNFSSCIIFFLSVMLILVFSGCANTKGAEERVREEIESFKNRSAGDTYFDSEIHTQGIFQFADPEVMAKHKDEAVNLLFELMREELSYDIISAKKTARDEVTVSVEVTNIDMYRYMDNYVNGLSLYLEKAVDAKKDSKKDIQEKSIVFLMDYLRSSRGELITITTDIVVIKDNGEWLISNRDDLLNALSGNLLIWQEGAMEKFGGDK